MQSTCNDINQTGKSDGYNRLSLYLDKAKQIPKVTLALHPYAQGYHICPRNECILCFGKGR